MPSHAISIMKLSELSTEQVRSVVCPKCGAAVGQDCRYGYMGTSRDGLHKVRRKVARDVLIATSLSRDVKTETDEHT